MKNTACEQTVHYVSWRTPLGPSLSPYLNKIRMVRRLSYARFGAALRLADVSAKRVLDFGCWDGHFLPSLLKHFSEVWGIDDDSASLVETVRGCWTILQVAQTLAESEVPTPLPPIVSKAQGEALPFPD